MSSHCSLRQEIAECLHLSLPLAGAQLAFAATGFVDTVMMGGLGSDYLAAGGLGATTFTSLLVVGTGVVSAVSPFIAEAYGAQQADRAGRMMDQGIWLAIAVALPITILLGNAAPVLRLLGQEETVVRLAAQYLRAIAWGYLPGLLFVVLRSFVTALSQPRPVILIMGLGVGLNAIANYILMYGKLGLPALGLVGIGWSSTLVYWSMGFALVVYVMRQPQYAVYRPFRTVHRFQGRLFGELIAVGLPIGILATFETGMFSVVTFMAGHLGTTALAAHQIALQTIVITFMVPLGISQAMTVRVGQLVGRQQESQARRAGYVGLALGLAFMGSMATVMLVAPQLIVALYLDITLPDNQDVVRGAIALLAVGGIFQLFDGAQVVSAGALRGLKDTRIPMVVGVVAYWIVGLPSGYLGGFVLGLGGVGLWCGLAIGLAIAAITLTWRFHRLLAPRLDGY